MYLSQNLKQITMKLQLGKLEIEVKEFPFKLYDKDGNMVYYRNSNGIERWSEYDEKGNITHYRNSCGDEFWSEYDEKGNVTHYRNSNGIKSWAKYDKNGNEIYYRDSFGIERGTPRAKSCEGKVVEIEGKKYQLKEIK